MIAGPAARGSEQRHEHRHAHVARVRERRHQRAERRVVDVDPEAQRRHDRERDDHQRAEDVDADGAGGDGLHDRCRRAEPEQHARQREVEDERVEARNRRERQHAAPRGDVAAQHEREERKGDEEDGEHGGYCRRWPILAGSRRIASGDRMQPGPQTPDRLSDDSPVALDRPPARRRGDTDLPILAGAATRASLSSQAPRHGPPFPRRRRDTGLPFLAAPRRAGPEGACARPGTAGTPSVPPLAALGDTASLSRASGRGLG